MLRFHDLLVERQDEVLDLLQWEVGKARVSTPGRRWPRSQASRGTTPAPGARTICGTGTCGVSSPV